MDYILNLHKSFNEKELKYLDFIKGKKVMIVGPSPWMVGKNYGNYIDSFDIVIRINQGIYLTESNPQDFGSKTDVAYLCQRARDIYKHNFPPIFEQTKFIILLTQVKYSDHPSSDIICFVCNTPLKEKEEYCLNADWGKDEKNIKLGHMTCIHPTLNQEYEKYKVPILKKDIAYYQKLFKISVLSGLFAVIDMIQCQAGEINVFGFDFYDGIKDAILNNQNDAQVKDLYCNDYKILKNTLRLSHKDNEANQLDLFYKIMNFKNITTKINIDENLQRILNKYFFPEKRFKGYETEYFQFIKDKKIIIIGPSPWLQGKNLGDFIDSHDIVIRINLGFELCKHNYRDFGKKCHILYLNHKLRMNYLYDFPKDIEKVMYIAVESKVMYENNINCFACNKLIEKDYEYCVDDNNYYHFNCFHYTNYKLMQRKIITVDTNPLYKFFGEKPLTGMSAIRHLTSFHPKSIHVMGFDFYNKIKEASKKLDMPITLTDLYSKNHKISGKFNIEEKDVKGKQLKAFKKLCQSREYITMDDNLQNIINKL